MNSTTFSTAEIRADMIEDALGLLRIIEVEHDQEDINETPEARTARIRLRAMARKLVARMIGDIRAPERREPPAALIARAA